MFFQHTRQMHLILRTSFLVSLFLACSGQTGSRNEYKIYNGLLVDYSTTQRVYPFMARLVMDGAFRCGGAVISDR